MKEHLYGTWGYFKDNADKGYISDEAWIRNRCKQYIRINLCAYVIKAAVILGLMGIMIAVGIDNNTKLAIFLSAALLAIPFWVIMPPESCRRFIEYLYVELREHEIVVFRRLGLQTKIRKNTVLYGPFTYSYRYLANVLISQDRILIKFKSDNPYENSVKYGSMTLENNFKKSDELIEKLKEKIREDNSEGVQLNNQ